MTAPFPYTGVVIFDKLTISLLETSISDDEREMELRINNQARGLLQLATWDMPRMSLGRGELLLWGGMRLYALDLADGPLRQFDLKDQLCEAYRLDDYWCLVCETSILLWDSRSGEVLAERLHDEILLNVWWDSDRLFVDDLQRRKLEVRVDEREGQVSLELAHLA